jgi:hypothetical protein
LKAIAVQPESPLHGLEGLKHMATAITPGIFDETLVAETLEVATEDALLMTSKLAREEGLLVGPSSGANVFAAWRVAASLREPAVVVTVLCDSGERYLARIRFSLQSLRLCEKSFYDDKPNQTSHKTRARGERRVPDAKPVATPIYATATFTYDSMQEIDQVFSGEKQGFIYTRYGNPTIAALEEAVRDVEEGATACAYSTGMAAVHAALLACDLKAGSTVLASQDLYGATTSLLNNVLAFRS